MLSKTAVLVANSAGPYQTAAKPISTSFDQVYASYWNILIPNHTCPKISKGPFNYLWMFLELLDEWRSVDPDQASSL